MEWRRGNTTLVLYWRMMGGRLLLTLCTAYYQAAATARRKLTAKNGVCYQMQIFEWCISKCVTFTMCFTHNGTTNHMRQIGYWQSHLNWIKFSLFLPSNTFLSITLQLVQNKYSWRGGSWDICYICFCGSGQLKQWYIGLLDGQLGILDHSTQQLSTAQCKMQSIKTAISGMHQNTRLTDIKTTQTRLKTLCMVRSELSWQMKEAAVSRLKLFCSFQLKCFLKHWM